MSIRTSVWAVAALSTSVLVAGCGSKGGTAATSSSSSTAQISGVVKTANSAGAIAKAGHKGVFGATVSSLPQAVVFANALVLATDATGNTSSTTSDAVGAFTLTLTSGKSYALIFINPKTLKVLGSLVQASDTASPAAVSLNGNAALGDIVVDPTTGKAVSDGDVTGAAPSVPAGTMDANGDGQITTDDVTTLQVNAITAGGTSAVQTMSVMTFMGEPDTWTLEQRQETLTSNQDWGNTIYYAKSTAGVGGATETHPDGIMERLDLNVRRTRSVTGPKGDTVTAVKTANVGIYNTFQGDYAPVTYPGGTKTVGTTANYASATGGYYNYTNIDTCVNSWTGGNWAWCGDLVTYGVAATTGLNTFVDGRVTATTTTDSNQFLNAWGRYNYGDTAAGQTYEGQLERSAQNGSAPKIEWNPNVPLNLTIGKAMSMSNSKSWSMSNGGTTYYFAASQSMNFTPTIADTLIDKIGNKLPVLHVAATGSFTMGLYSDAAHTTLVTDTMILGNMGWSSNPMTQTMSEAFYIVGKYGAQVPAKDAAGTAIAWATAKTKLRFGIVTPEKGVTVATGDIWNTCDAATFTNGLVVSSASPKVCDTTPQWGASANAAMPFASDATTAAARDSWLVALAQHIDDVDKPRGNSSTANPYMWLKRNGDGMAAEVIGWDPVSYKNYPLIGGTASESFTTTLVPDTYPTGTAGVTQGTAGETVLANYNLVFNLGNKTDVNVDFLFELRTYDSTAANQYSSTGLGSDVPVLVASAPVRSTPVTAATIIANGGSALTANNGEYTGKLTGTLAIPDVSVFSGGAYTDPYKQHWYYGDYVGGTWTNYCAAPVTVWIIMRDISGGAGNETVINEQPVSWYTVRRSTSLGAGEACN